MSTEETQFINKTNEMISIFLKYNGLDSFKNLSSFNINLIKVKSDLSLILSKNVEFDSVSKEKSLKMLRDFLIKMQFDIENSEAFKTQLEKQKNGYKTSYETLLTEFENLSKELDEVKVERDILLKYKNYFDLEFYLRNQDVPSTLE